MTLSTEQIVAAVAATHPTIICKRHMKAQLRKAFDAKGVKGSHALALAEADKLVNARRAALGQATKCCGTCTAHGHE